MRLPTVMLFSVLIAGCVSSSPGVVRTTEDNPIVVVGAGEIAVGGGEYYHARYVIDRKAQVCWFFAGESVAAMDCCALRRVPEAQPFLSWAHCPVGPVTQPLAAPPPSPPPPPPSPPPWTPAAPETSSMPAAH
jgi:hypothetical protein